MVAQASIAEADVLSDVIKEYYCMSGEKVDMAKSQVIYGVNIRPRQRRLIKRALKVEETHCPIKYLEVFIGMKRLPHSLSSIHYWKEQGIN